MEAYSLGPEYSDVDVKAFFSEKMRQGKAGQFFKVFTVKEASVEPQASCDGMMVKDEGKPQEEKTLKESQGLEEEDRRKGFAANEDAAKKMLKYLEDSEDLKVSLGFCSNPRCGLAPA